MRIMTSHDTFPGVPRRAGRRLPPGPGLGPGSGAGATSGGRCCEVTGNGCVNPVEAGGRRGERGEDGSGGGASCPKRLWDMRHPYANHDIS